MPREVVYCLIFIALLFGTLIYVFFPQDTKGHAHRLGQDLDYAAQMRDWVTVKQLLDEGADPDVTEIRPDQLRHGSIYNLWGLLSGPGPSSAPGSGISALLKRPSALECAIWQDNMDGVKMLLAHHATITANVLATCGMCGDRELITMVEDAGHVPPGKRVIATAPFTAAAHTARELVIPGTAGAAPVTHYLWLSPHELLLVRNAPRSSPATRISPRALPVTSSPLQFFSIDLNTNVQTDLPDLTKAWADQPELDAEELALSPDGQWLLGFGGTPEHPTWRATQVHGSGVQEWDRVAESDPKKRFRVGAHPLIAWRDKTRWLEINEVAGGKVVRLRALGSLQTQELPITSGGYGYIGPFDREVFDCPDPDHAFLRGACGVTNSLATGPEYVLFMAGFTAGPTSWTEEKRGFNVSSKDQPGYTQRCVPSPDGKRLAWLQIFASGMSHDILLSDADGSNFRVVLEKLMVSPSARGRTTFTGGYIPDPRLSMPGTRSLDWTPDGSKLIYWHGENGEGGLCLLPLGAGE
jgi:hypothetical protein